MALHISLMAPAGGDTPYKVIFKKRFESLHTAMEWFNSQDFIVYNDEGRNTIRAAAKQYVGVELNLNSREGVPTDVIMEIEGQFGKETFDERYKDLVLSKVMYDKDSGHAELHGKDRYNNKVWMLLDLRQPIVFKTK